MKKFILYMIFPVLIFAQSGNLTGYVFDESGNPLPGVNVLVTGTGFGAATDTKGFFNIPDINYGTYDLEASSVGYKTKLIKNVLFNKL